MKSLVRHGVGGWNARLSVVVCTCPTHHALCTTLNTATPETREELSNNPWLAPLVIWSYHMTLKTFWIFNNKSPVPEVSQNFQGWWREKRRGKKREKKGKFLFEYSRGSILANFFFFFFFFFPWKVTFSRAFEKEEEKKKGGAHPLSLSLSLHLRWG